MSHVAAWSDPALVEAAQSGSADAAAAIVRRYYPRVRSFALRLTNGRESADDLAQEVFTRALAALDRLDPQCRLEPWLLRIARNLCFDLSKRGERRSKAMDPSTLASLREIPSEDYVWRSIAQRWAGGTVRAALARLSPRQRGVLVLREIEGLSYARIAQILGVSPRAVEVALRRARSRFEFETQDLTRADVLD